MEIWFCSIQSQTKDLIDAHHNLLIHSGAGPDHDPLDWQVLFSDRYNTYLSSQL